MLALLGYRHSCTLALLQEGKGKSVTLDTIYPFAERAGFVINADCQGAANILKKVITQLGIILAKVTKGVLTLPQRYVLTRLNKSYRKRCEASIYCASTTSA